MILNDPIHKKIILADDIVYDLVQTRAFQRLKELKQQGNTYFLLPNTLHNRLSHSLGVYENMRKMVDELVINKGLSLTEYEVNIALVSALLHDIGHGPYSHCFENISDIHHEKWTVRIIKENAEISTILLRTPGLLDAVISVMERKGEYAVIEELLFSHLGADKLDYHLRDLLYSGISQEAYNLNTLIRGLHIHEGKLAIDSDTIQEIEKFVVIKRKLFEQGFNHPDIIGKDVLLKLVFRRAKHLYEHKEIEPIPILTPLFSGELWTVDDYLQLNDQVIYNLITEWLESSDTVLSKLSIKYIAGIENSIKWVEHGTSLCESGLIKTDPFTSEFFMQDEKYGCYSAGIYVLDSGRLVDISEKSQVIKDYSAYNPKKFLYYVD